MMPFKSLKLILLITAVILIIPLIAMQFTNEVNWSFLDFIIAGLLLIGLGMLIDLVIRKTKNMKFRVLILILIVLLFILLWAELAVGIFGTPIGGS